MSSSLQRYLGARQAYAPSFSPDGRRLGFLSNLTGVPQAWIMPARGGFPEPLTFGVDRVQGVWYSPAAERLIFARDAGGNENTQLSLVDADGSNERRLTTDDGAQHLFGGWSPDGTRIAFTANLRTRGRYDLYVQAMDDGAAELVWQNETPGIVSPAAFSPDGTRVLVVLGHGSFDQDLYEVDLATQEARLITPHEDQVRNAEGHFAAYSADGASVYCLSDLGREFAGVRRIDLRDLSTQWVAAPECEIDFAALSRDGRYLAWAENYDGAHTLARCDLHTGARQESQNLPHGVVSPLPDSAGLTFAPDGRTLAFSFTTPRRPLDVWLWNIEPNAVAPVTRSTRAGIPEVTLVEPELIHYTTFDNRSIPAWFYRPLAGDKPYPVIVWVHGGPEGQTQPVFFPLPQYFLSRGYAVLQPNVRGSTGYGKTYSHLDDVDKRMDSVADLAYAVDWLRAQPELDATRVVVYGQSYGGFMVLAALTTYPELWAAGVELVGISNWVTFLEHTSDYRRSARELEYGSLARDREFLTRVSPIQHVDQIRAPLFVIHGANDPRVPVGETEQIVAALRARNVPVEFLVYADEGHGLVKLANQLDAYPKVAAFLDRYLNP